jgi:two-component system, LytTR family, response regulator
MITAIIIDDEPKARLSLRQKLIDYCPDVKLIGEAGGGEEGLDLIERLQPNIVFLDIEMPHMNGFDMLLRVPQQNFHLIFSTAYDHYAIKAIRFAAFDYLLKPVNIDELREVIRRVKNDQQLSNTPMRIKALVHNLKDDLNKIAIPTIDGLLFFNINEIMYIEAQSNYTVFNFESQPKLTVSKTLKDFEGLLSPDLFFRPHNSYIINLKFIKRYIKGDGGKIEMQNGKFVEVSRRKKEEFLGRMGL